MTPSHARPEHDGRARAQPADRPGGLGPAAGVLRDRGHDVVVVDVQDDDTPAVRLSLRRPRRAAGPRRGAATGRSCWSATPARATCCRCSAPPGERPGARCAGTCSWTPGSRRAGRRAAATSCAPRTRSSPTSSTRCSTPAAGSRTWTDDDLRELVPDDAVRAALVASLRPRGADFFVEPLPFAAGLAGRPVRLPAALAGRTTGRPGSPRSRGWPVVEAGPADRPGGHFAALRRPGRWPTTSRPARASCDPTDVAVSARARRRGSAAPCPGRCPAAPGRRGPAGPAG